MENSWSNVCNRITISYTLTAKSSFRFLLCFLLLVSLVIEHASYERDTCEIKRNKETILTYSLCQCLFSSGQTFLFSESVEKRLENRHSPNMPGIEQLPDGSGRQHFSGIHGLFQFRNLFLNLFVIFHWHGSLLFWSKFVG